MVHLDDRPPGEPLPQHVTTPLLTLITERSLDEDYAHVAAGRAAAGRPPTRRMRPWSLPLVVALFGALATIAAVQTSRDAAVNELSRDALIKEVQSGRVDVAVLQRRVRSLREQGVAASAANEDLLEQTDDLENRRRRLEVSTGHVAVRGPGVRIRVSSAPNADPNDEVRDDDLALLVNGLWTAGAEAIAINDQRINALGGIRNTNRAVHVNGRPLTAPYVVQAIGDRSTLAAGLLESSSGLQFFGRVETYEFGYVSQNVEELRLAAAPPPVVRHAEVTTTDKPSADSAQPTKGGDAT